MTELPDYKSNDPKGWCGDPKRGAALGRHTIKDVPSDWKGKLHLRKVRIDQGGYDSNGTYFGLGDPLYWYANKEGTIDAMLRASNRAQAREKVLAIYPGAEIRR